MSRRIGPHHSFHIKGISTPFYSSNDLFSFVRFLGFFYFVSFVFLVFLICMLFEREAIYEKRQIANRIMSAYSGVNHRKQTVGQECLSRDQRLSVEGSFFMCPC